MCDDSSIPKQRAGTDVFSGGQDISELDSIVPPISWMDINAHAVVLPEYEEEALRQIEFQLGYLPPRAVTLADEPFIRYALYMYDFHHNDFDRLCNECKVHLQSIGLRSIALKVL